METTNKPIEETKDVKETTEEPITDDSIVVEETKVEEPVGDDILKTKDCKDSTCKHFSHEKVKCGSKEEICPEIGKEPKPHKFAGCGCKTCVLYPKIIDGEPKTNKGCQLCKHYTMFNLFVSE